MPKKRRFSKEEMIEYAARLVAGTINPYDMGIEPKDVDVECFVRLFIDKASEIYDEQGELHISIGDYLKVEKQVNNFQEIIEYVERKSNIKFYFFNGILIYICQYGMAANWIPDRPL